MSFSVSVRKPYSNRSEIMEREQAVKSIIFALDVSKVDEAIRLVELLKDHVGMFKIGLELQAALFCDMMQRDSSAANLVYSMARRLFQLLDGNFFFDGKFNDIPTTVAGAARNVAFLNPAIIDVHASAGIKAMHKAVLAVKNVNSRTAVIAVTVLTSLNEDDCQLLFGMPVKARVLQFARDALMAKCDGIVCSPLELEFLSQYPELKALQTIVPGTRSEWAASGDQQRIMTPREAAANGATWQVHGSAIRKYPDDDGGPVAAAKLIAKEIASGMLDREVKVAS
ncbi:MAG: orotidine-5'-phosphate decarboxylase [Calditrichaeota bacterium]|nr:orotidine-5'-phosphate decarboxylase [Calditrichota bacterium]